MQFIPYLDFNGQCREAFAFYAKVFDAEITMQMTYGESPEPMCVPTGNPDRIMHTQLEHGGGVLMGADSPTQTTSRGVCVNVTVATAAEAERIFHALADGGEVQMPMERTFWAERFGMLADRYGKPWMVMAPPA